MMIDSSPLPFKTLIVGEGGVECEGATELYLANLGGIQALMLTAFPEGHDEWLDLFAIAQAGGLAIIYNTPDKLAGFMHAKPKDLVNGPEGKAIWTGTVLVSSPQGAGIGGTIIELFKREAPKMGAKALFMRTDPTRKEAISFYVKHGFVHAGTVQGYYLYGDLLAPAVWLRVHL